MASRAGALVNASVVAGIDGCRWGWLCLTRDMASGRVAAHILSRIDEVDALRPKPQIVAVDIPIGLLPSGSRACDVLARAALGAKRASSVFPAPGRALLGAASHAEACMLGRNLDGRAISIQAWNIVPKIREVDDFLRLKHAGKNADAFCETHPELSFMALNNGLLAPF